MKNFVEPSIEILKFEMIDVVLTSDEENVLPEDEF
jgi:type III secretory pathway lipoprotein EscJ